MLKSVCGETLVGQFIRAEGGSILVSAIVALLRQQLFVYRDLFAWLDDPFEPPPALQGIHDTQLSLSFNQV
jgi:hypothetical protein